MTRLVALLLAATLSTCHGVPVYASGMRASWYDCRTPGQCSRSKVTASGEYFLPNGLTAAHRTLPFGTRLRVCLIKCVVVRITDRGPFIKGRQLDLSAGAARVVGLRGVAVVRADVL
jgi:rare lipoprotein A